MKKKAIILLIVLVVLVLITPIPMGQAKDGGTKVYGALTYKIVKWNHIYGEESEKLYNETKVYLFPNNFQSIDELIELEINE